ncbi:acyl-CoA thioesterase [Nocardiopsis ansamitocini]|uniref:Thioesterase n=1 Tax=Nocardiopsis ansamitocini TaxID=1670832 RepID=A0A9W6UKM6_9ACTN|nr:thioesterase family protein [Nocardiopsis ansamitocini]GLU49892.1 thioesterase [Nocardiopsis ansamitocini]
MSTFEDTPPAAEPEFGRVQSVDVHFEDLDPTGFLHNSRYSLLLEHAASAYWSEQGWHHDPARSRFAGDSVMAVRAFEITYHFPVTEPGKVGVHLWIERIGRSSYTYGFRVISLDGATVHAEGTRVQINLDPTTLTPATLSDEVRAAAQPLLRAPAQPPGETA